MSIALIGAEKANKKRKVVQSPVSRSHLPLSFDRAMWYWRKDYFQTLKDVGSKAAQFAEWADYATFCSEYENGLRTQAFATLERFMSTLEHAPFAERRHFVGWLMQTADGTRGKSMAVPYPLRLRLIEPTLIEWTAVEPWSSEPHRWLGGYDHLKTAIELNPNDQLATRKLVSVILGSIGTHQLPDHYVGDPRRDLAALNEADTLLQGIAIDDDRQSLKQMIEEERLLVTTYLCRRNDSSDGC